MEKILKEAKKVIIVNAGHYDADSGATYQDLVEAIECKKIRDQLVPILTSRGYKVHAVPDSLNLKKSIEWANNIAPALNDALAIDIHLNFLSDTNARGTEAFHGTTETSKQIADVLSYNISEQLGIPNRGAKSDTTSFVGSLGWIRKVSAWSTLVEVCFMSNKDDMTALTKEGGYKQAAKGIANAVDEIFGEETPVVISQGKTLADYTLKELMNEIVRRFNQFK